MSTLRLISWNVNGIRAIEKKGGFAWFRQEQPDIFCIQETKAHQTQLAASLIEIDGYTAYFAEAERKGYSGVAVYTAIPPKSVTTGLGIDRFDREGRTLILEFEPFTLFNIYYPNGKASKERLQYKMDFYDAFLEHADRLKTQGKQLVVCGDVNTAHTPIDLARPKENEKVSGFLPEERAWLDTLREHGYVDTLRMLHPEPGLYTWWDQKSRARERNVGWRIDYFFVSEGLRNAVKDAYILSDVTGSDHCPIGLDIEV
jgi:exodeoxyribonuclease III